MASEFDIEVIVRPLHALQLALLLKFGWQQLGIVVPCPHSFRKWGVCWKSQLLLEVRKKATMYYHGPKGSGSLARLSTLPK